jgi:hypothetical protein
MLAFIFAAGIAAAAAAAAATGTAPDPRAVAVVDTAIARMGGADVLGRIQRVRFELLTQWQRTSFANQPYADQPSYELHSDVRDYTIPAWRNTRRFQLVGTPRPITDIVRDSVAIRQINGAWAPLNVAYVDERRELFTFAADRLVLLARAAPDLAMAADTTIGGLPHARVTATVAGFPATLFFRRGDGLLAMARYRAAQPNDFGLVPWGVMDVELWYSRWQRLPSGAVLPHQWDTRRVGQPYKRITVLAAAFDTVATADSFAVSDSLRRAFFATANRPMHDLPLDSARVVEPRLATFGAFGAPSGAVKLGRQWMLLEPGQAALSVERAAAWLARTDSGATLGGALVTTPTPANGGAEWLAARRVPMHAGPGAMPFLQKILANHGRPASAATAISRGRWIRADGDSLWVEPIDLPDAAGALLVYVPSLRWAYAGMAAGPLQRDFVLARIRERGWAVERLGTLRAIATPLPGPR